MSEKTILLADDDAAIRTVLNHALSRAGYQVRTTANIATLWRWISNGEGDLVVTDVVMPDGNAFELMPRMKRHRPELPIIVMSAQNTFMTAVKASEKGAYDYLPKPFDLQELIATVERALSQSFGADVLTIPDQGENMPLVGRSPAMQEVYRIVARLMQSDLTLMINGESGTGKELVAKALHDYGKRSAAPFVAINMAAIPRDLIESELFGHEKGAFTGAHIRSSGKFEQAEGGTLFLDEIGDMPMDAQTRLLRVLQQGEYTTVGGRSPIQTDVRIVAATNKNLTRLISDGQFREDLYYRLNVVPLRIPPLRERVEDIPDLVQHFLQKTTEDGFAMTTIEAEALDVFRDHPWPGNVRELENIIRRIAALYPNETISRQIVETELYNDRSQFLQEGKEWIGPRSLHALVEHYALEQLKNAEQGEEIEGLYHQFLREVEHPLISVVLASTNGNQIKAAQILGLNRNTLRKKIKDHEIAVSKNIV